MKKYKDTINFMGDINTWLMEVVESITSWVMPMGYELEDDILTIHVDDLSSKLVDPSVPRF